MIKIKLGYILSNQRYHALQRVIKIYDACPSLMVLPERVFNIAELFTYTVKEKSE